MASKKYKQRLVLFDAHAILHRGYHALPQFTTSAGFPSGGLYGLSTILIRIISELKPDYLVACYDRAEPTFRKQVYEDYKAHRVKADDELVEQIKKSPEIFEAFGIPVISLAGFEADDIIGTIVEKTKKIPDLQIVIASGDMDTLQLVEDDKVIVYTLKKGLNDTITYDEKGVMERYSFKPPLLVDYKGLRGDPSDNIIGVKGIGEKTATDLITKVGSIEQIYQLITKKPEQFLKLGFKQKLLDLLKTNEEEAEFSKTLATIRRDAPIEYILPPKTYEGSSHLPTIEKIFLDLEFRSLIKRVRDLFNGGGDNLAVDKEALEEEKEEEIIVAEPLLSELKIAAWLINSELTDPTVDQVLHLAKTRDPAEAKRILEQKITEAELDFVYREIELPLIPILTKAKERGILLDVPYLQDLGKKWHKNLSAIEQKIWKLAGHEFNIGSPKQMGEILFDELKLSIKGLKKTQGGARSTRESELLKLKDSHPIIEPILEYRELSKLLSTYVDVLPKLVDEEGRVHSTLVQTGAATGRMSSRDPNLQNLPAQSGFGEDIRRGFISSPGKVFVGADYSQIEMRLLAELSDDQNLIDIFKSGRDVHTEVAANVFGVTPDAVTKEMRRAAKVINFGIIYGMGVNALKTNLGGTREEAQTFYNNYFASYPSIRNYFDNVIAEAKKTGYTKTLFGRRRYFPGFRSKLPFLIAAAERAAANAPIQGTATGDIIKLAIIKIDQELIKRGLADSSQFILQVHDELIYEVDKDKAEEVKKLVVEVMSKSAELRVPLLAEASIGNNISMLK